MVFSSVFIIYLIILVIALYEILIIKYLLVEDSTTFLISLTSFLPGFYYIYSIDCGLRKEKDEFEDKLKKEDKTKEFTEVSLKDSNLKDIILKDYEITNIETERRDNITLIIGTILITASFLVLGNSIKEGMSNTRFISAITSIGLFLIWLLGFHYTTQKLNYMAYARVHIIENKLKSEVKFFGVHSFLYDRTKDTKWVRIRRIFWGLIFFLLNGCWLLLSSFQ